jgi:uncharacterized protein YwgA
MKFIAYLSALLRSLGWDGADSVGAQKRIYLLQKAGLRLPYSFAWDVMGPFSSDLAEDIRLLVALGDEIPNVEVRHPAIEQVSTMRSIAGSLELEIAASLLYLQNQHKQSITKEALVDELEALKPWVRDHRAELDRAWEDIHDFVAAT